MFLTRKQRLYVKSFWPWYDLKFKKDGTVEGKRKSDPDSAYGVLLSKKGLEDLLDHMGK